MDHEVRCHDHEDISESFAAAIDKATDRVADRIVLSIDQAEALLECFNELWDEVAVKGGSPSKSRRRKDKISQPKYDSFAPPLRAHPKSRNGTP